ncbi:hypothetical protein F0U44_00655 [Nocardioides humilatus]|uniref:Uncharacterized protein n=1 Tax=Nocardioides humilatus TaxID=2607660 RepID=A0A5B1LJI7_9ACTN|nr:MXAN_6640 family putative metalloprotease [Nocardioides humilatus]KAA1420895.1 hypothetical protein F0U44_00655 [Nocardioides humilatus]
MKLSSLLVLPISVALAASLTVPAAVADDDFDQPDLKVPGTSSSKAAEAKDTLAEVQAIVNGDAKARGGRTSDGRDLTVALRDLRVQTKYLSPADKKVAHQFLLRPGTGSDPYIPGALPINKCFVELCIHYAETGTNAVLDSDGDANTIPAYVQNVADTINQINVDYVAAGYRTPKRDGALGGGTNKIDIYLGQIGNQGLYGFCTSDDPNNPDTSGDYSFWAYCALDNDYAPAEFPTNTPTENMQVTAAHEFFHAVQYAYDAWEDGWLLESTATWVEDEMFDGVDDNRQYLANGPLGLSYVPLDYYGDGFHYGTWIWWRYLTEKFPAKTGKLPNLVRKVWERADGAPGGPDDYSTQGLAKVLSNLGTTLKKEFVNFSTVNRNPKKYYSEGANYPTTQALVQTINPSHKIKGANWTSGHLASATSRFNPQNLGAADWRLKVTLDFAPTDRGSAAVILVYKKNGKIERLNVKLNQEGNGAKNVPFSSGSIKGVEVLMINSSSRFNCYTNPDSPYSCLGTPKDDGPKYEVTAKAYRA